MDIRVRDFRNPDNWKLLGTRVLKMLMRFQSNFDDLASRVLVILGCQRSGTSLIYWVFERDLRTKIYREASKLSTKDPRHLRLDPFTKIRKELASQKAPLLVLKPLVESQRALHLLANIPNSKILWMYRDFDDVAASNLKAFGRSNGIRDLRLMLNGPHQNWRREKLRPETASLLRRFYRRDMNPYDAAALFWYARNMLYFDQRLDEHDSVMLCKYEDLGKHPHTVMQSIYMFLEISYPGRHVVRSVHAGSVGRGARIDISAEIRSHCNELLQRLDSVPKRYRVYPANRSQA